MKHWTIRWRIIASFGVMLALIITMTALQYNRLLAIETEATAVESLALSRLQRAAAVRDAWVDDLLVTEQLVFEADEGARRRLEASLERSRQTLETALGNAQDSLSTPEDREALAAFKAAQSSYIRVQDDVVGAAADPARRAQAMAMIGARLLPEHERGRTPLNALTAQKQKAADAALEQVAADVNRTVAGAKAAALFDLLLAVIVGAASGVGLMLSISRPLSTLKGLVDVMRSGDFTKRAPLVRRDEFGALAEGFNRMADDLTSLVGQVKDSSLKVSTSVTEIAATAKQQQATANEVAATTTEIGATSREIAATSKELLRTMGDVSVAAEQSASIAGTGQAGLTLMEQSMRNVIDAAGSVNTKLTTLNERAADISQVVTTITKVADQTNLLSLNAAIEAEKAGEYGRGFAVVATEIRRLADQTAVATHDIDRTVKAIQSAVSSSVMSMDKFSEQVRQGMQSIQEVGAQLTEIIQHTQALAPRFETVTEGMQAQATGAEQITEALTQLSEAARQTVESLRQSSIAIDDLNQVSLGLRGGVSRFTLQAA